MLINSKRLFDEALVLVIYDNGQFNSDLNNVLTSAGLRPIFVSRAEKGLSVLKHAKESGTPLALVICDIAISDMPGEAFVRAVRLDHTIADTKIVMLTSDQPMGQLSRFSPLNVSHILKWPCRAADLTGAIAEYIPIRRELSPPPADQSAGAPVSSAPLKILAADDNAINLAVLRGFLNLAGYSPDTVRNGAEAVKAFKNMHYDLILMDISMPVMDGIVATLQIREIEKRIGKTPVPIVAVTAHYTPSQRDRYLEVGMNDVIAKPIRQEKIESCLEKWCDRYNPAQIALRAAG